MLRYVYFWLPFFPRHNAFEVCSMDGGASVVLYSENTAELFSWYSSIKDRIAMLLDHSVSRVCRPTHSGNWRTSSGTVQDFISCNACTLGQ